MENEFMEEYHYSHLIPRTLQEKDKYLSATHSIQDSFLSIPKYMPLHSMFIEASIELRNAIKQFEEGYIGSAFYSVRTAVELARVVAFFSTIDSPVQSEDFTVWVTGGKFPFDGELKKKIEETSDIYVQVKEATGSFFDDQAKHLRVYQKYIHKQGYRPFYERGFGSKQAAVNRMKKIDTDFESFLGSSIVEIAILRLCIDPMPLLLNDPNVMRKIHMQMMAYPYSDELMELLAEKADQYRQTNFYKDNVAYFDSNEELSDEALILINESYYSRSWKGVIVPQLHLLSVYDRVPVLLFNLSEKISKIYSIGGWEQVFSDVKSLRTKMSWSSEMFNDSVGINQAFDEAFLTYVKLFDQEFWIEHNEPFSPEDLSELSSLDDH